jgi:hypothetical protein
MPTAKGTEMRRSPLLGSIAGLLLTGCANADPDFGLVLRSADFGDPCTSDPGNIPRIYDNGSTASADVSVKVANTGGSNILVSGTGFVIPPDGAQRRPRVIRLTVPTGGSIGLEGQAANCAWTATIWPH